MTTYSREQLTDLAIRAATIHERLSDGFAPLPGQRAETDAAAQRLAAWCQSAAGGDWVLFAKRLRRGTRLARQRALDAIVFAAASPSTVI
jgi:hypothetical protein